MMPSRNGTGIFPFACPPKHEEFDDNADSASSSSNPNNWLRGRKPSSDIETQTAALHLLKVGLSNIPHDKKSALVHAQRVRPELVDDDHMMGFLRAEDFDAGLGLKRLVRYWEHRYKVFGPDRFILPMTLNGAMKDCIPALKQGFITLLPVLDNYGRAIMYSNSSSYRHPMPKSEEKIKVWWYLLHVAMENPSVSKKGFIILTNSRDSRISQHDSKWYLAACSSGDRDFPIRWKMAHVCHANAVFPIVASAVKAILSPEQRESFILHSGSNERVLESLSEYSLSADCIPTHLGGTIQVSTDDFIRKRLAVEGGSLDIESNEVPSTTSQNMDIDAHEAWRDMTNIGTVIDRSIISSISPEAFYCISRNRNQLDAAARNYGCVANTKLTSQPIKADHFDSMVFAAANSNAINIVMAEEGNQHSHVQNIQVEAQQKQNSGGPFLRGETKQARGKKGETAKAHPGRLGDPRMNMAVAAKLNDPDLPLLDALLAGGFVFPDLHVRRVKVSTVKDTDNVTVYQRRNQLLRRLRVAKAKDKKKALQM